LKSFLGNARYILLFGQKVQDSTKIDEMIVHTSGRRKIRETKIGMDRFINGFLDLINHCFWFVSKIWQRTLCTFLVLWESLNVYHWFWYLQLY